MAHRSRGPWTTTDGNATPMTGPGRSVPGRSVPGRSVPRQSPGRDTSGHAGRRGRCRLPAPVAQHEQHIARRHTTQRRCLLPPVPRKPLAKCLYVCVCVYMVQVRRSVAAASNTARSQMAFHLLHGVDSEVWERVAEEISSRATDRGRWDDDRAARRAYSVRLQHGGAQRPSTRVLPLRPRQTLVACTSM